MALDFYHGHGSPYSWRVWLALEFKGIAYNLKVLSFQNEETKKPEFVALNPRHTVPTLVDDGHALWESLAILEYLDERFASGPKLYPGDARNRARIRRLIQEMAGYLAAEGIDVITGELFFKGDAPPDMAKVAEGRKRLKEELDYFARELRGKFLAGDEPTAADFVLMPFLGYVWRVNFRKPETKLDDVIPPAIAEYKKRIEALPYYDKTFPPHWR
ncbi:MAG: glutathione S-transferase [Myxococcales bacterium]|jgi:glutathione S-transferase|nr:glutathione S-transferase [Myxococcales bacterium]